VDPRDSIIKSLQRRIDLYERALKDDGTGAIATWTIDGELTFIALHIPDKKNWSGVHVAKRVIRALIFVASAADRADDKGLKTVITRCCSVLEAAIAQHAHAHAQSEKKGEQDDD